MEAVRDAYAALKQHPAIQRELAEQAASEILLNGDAAVGRKDFTSACRIYREASSQYPETAGGRAAAEKLATILADPEVAEAMRRQEMDITCKARLARARMLMREGNRAEAESICREIIDLYPDTSYAEEARDMLP